MNPNETGAADPQSQSSTQLTTRAWQNAGYAAEWTDGDALSAFLSFPRQIAASLVQHAGKEPELIADIGSGPGTFLAEFLARFPNVRGLWIDVAQEMQSEAEQRLTSYSQRLEFQILDMTNLSSLKLADKATVILTSRATHHLTVPELTAFYTAAKACLAPGGWLINLDHVGTEPVWQERLRTMRSHFMPPNRSPHPHPNPLPTLRQHLNAYASAGITDLEVPWRAFYTCLFAGRTSEPDCDGT